MDRQRALRWLIRPTPLAVAAGVAVALTTLGVGTHTTVATASDHGSAQNVLVNISGNSAKFGSVFPQVAVSPVDDDTVAVAWRQYTLPVDTNAPKDARTAACHVSVSTDAGRTFKDTDITPYFRADPDATALGLYYCNAPWVTFGPDGRIYAGGSVFTANGTTGALPKQGRAMVTVSTDNGTTWAQGIWGIDLAKLAPGLTGLNGGMAPQDTPWDGSNGFTDPTTGTFYSTAGVYVVASDDHAGTFGTVNQPNVAGWPRSAGGTMTAASGILAEPFVASATTVAGTHCPCLALATSTDEGKTFTAHLIAQAADFSTTGTTRYPVAAADRSRAGHFAVVAYTADHLSVRVYITTDAGRTWKTVTPRTPAGEPVVNANQVSVGYTADGRVLVVWRGFHRDQGAFDTYAALVDNGHAGTTVKVSPERSVYPPLTYLGNYGDGNGAGDFTTWITGNREYAYIAFPYSPGALVEDTYLARVPLSSLK
ncbi:hypothetical protein Raf01_41650 [Rugosimonospora africana]|uniref:Exo-alpha-sialidase n=1 Tax=Rugosimonospora africana TaxID=556532 RepID=A0A8J3QSD7_9ACTN|nr:hypothetical protein Raf01_41650 [Rugosimonospora africana]